MRRVGLICSALVGLLAITAVSGRATNGKLIANAAEHRVLEQFFAIPQTAPQQLTTIRRMEARNEHFDSDAWMEVRTEADATGFRYEVLGEGGSTYIRSNVFRPALQTERKIWMSGDADRGAFTLENYEFEDRGAGENGLVWLGITPRRKDLLLVNGSMFLRPEDGDLVRIEGALAKNPSFWTKRVEILRRYERIEGVRLPVWMESTATIRIAGKSTYSTSYRYLSVNGRPIPRN
jgi:hypothetical protein